MISPLTFSAPSKELRFCHTTPAVKGTLGHEALARSSKHIKRDDHNRNQEERATQSEEKPQKENKTKHGREDERREVTLKAIRGFFF
jgi:hypothetical protein